MASLLYVTEYAGMEQDVGGPVGLGTPVIQAPVNYASAAASSAAFGRNTRAIRVISDSSCAILISRNKVNSFTPNDGASGGLQPNPMPILGATQANPAVFNVANHGLTTNDTVAFQNLVGSGWTGLNGTVDSGPTPYVVTVVDANHFSIAVNSSAFTGTTRGGVIQADYRGHTVDNGQYPVSGFTQATSTVSPVLPTATTGEFLAANEEKWYRVGPGQCISVITAS